ncbi:efflux RND transporter permease subunit [Candidatus Margulisiibacteriota bacterium]
MNKLFNFFVSRPRLGNIISVAIIFLGIMFFLETKFDHYPQVDVASLVITTKAPGFTPSEVEINLTKKIEDAVRTIVGVKTLKSLSRDDFSEINVELELDVDEESVSNRIKDAVNDIQDFPDGVQRTKIERRSMTSIPILQVGVSGTAPYKKLTELADILEKRFYNIPGVKQIKKIGYSEPEIKIRIDQKKIDVLGVSILEVMQAIKNRHIKRYRTTIDTIEAPRNIITVSGFNDLEEIENLIIRNVFNGTKIKLKDIAQVMETFKFKKEYSSINGFPAIILTIIKSEKGDIVKINSIILSEVQKIQKVLPKGIHLDTADNQAREINNMFQLLKKNFFIGMLFVLLFLTLFLGIWSAFWVTFGVTFTFCGIAIVIYACGFTLNTFTLGAMVVALGMIVDDAIIISESIVKKLEDGLTKSQAALKGLGAVAKPVTASVITTIISFTPLLFLPGLYGRFIFVVPLILIMAHLISLSEALFILPAHMISHFKGKGLKTKEFNRSFIEFLKSFFRIVLKLRYVIIIGAFILVCCTFRYAIKYMNFILLPTKAANVIRIDATFKNTRFEAAKVEVKKVEKVLRHFLLNDFDSFAIKVKDNLGQVKANAKIRLKNYDERLRNTNEVIRDLRRAIKTLNLSADVFVNIDVGAPPTGKALELYILGQDPAKRIQAAAKIEKYLADQNGIEEIIRFDQKTNELIEVLIDHDKLPKYGIDIKDIANTIRVAFEGKSVAEIKYNGDLRDLSLNCSPLDTNAYFNHLKKLIIPNKLNKLFYLKDIAKFKTMPGVDYHYHYNLEKCTPLYINVNRLVANPLKLAKGIQKMLLKDLAGQGTKVIFSGEAYDTKNVLGDLMKFGLISLLFLYLVLTFVFNSYFKPFLVLMAVPFGVSGVIIAQNLHNVPFSYMSILGAIGLFGIVVNDSIVLIDRIHFLFEKNTDQRPVAVLVQAVVDRFRPVILTSITTVAALFPLAYGLGGYGGLLAPLCLAMAYGILCSTLLTLIVLPCVYLIAIDVKKVFPRLKQG